MACETAERAAHPLPKLRYSETGVSEAVKAMPPPIVEEDDVTPLVWTKEPYKISDRPRKM